jgi:hypothetical protein
MEDPEMGGIMRHFQEAFRAGRCKYCGAPAETASASSSSVEGDDFNFLCMACRKDLDEFESLPENAFPDFRSTTDDAARKRMLQGWTERQDRQEEFMKRKVSERKSKGRA